jgi:hypothetical protein
MTALKAPGTDPQEGNAVAVLGVHIGLDFKDKAGKIGIFGGNGPASLVVRLRLAGQLHKGIQEEAHAEIGQGAAEKDGRLFACKHRP